MLYPATQPASYGNGVTESGTPFPPGLTINKAASPLDGIQHQPTSPILLCVSASRSASTPGVCGAAQDGARPLLQCHRQHNAVATGRAPPKFKSCAGEGNRRCVAGVLVQHAQPLYAMCSLLSLGLADPAPRSRGRRGACVASGALVGHNELTAGIRSALALALHVREQLALLWQPILIRCSGCTAHPHWRLCVAAPSQSITANTRWAKSSFRIF